MKEDDLRQQLLELSKREASLNFKMYELYEENRTLAIKLAGYIAENRLLGGSWDDKEAKKVMDKYLVREKSEQKG